MTAFPTPSLDTVYATSAFGTLLFGLVAISAGARSEVVAPIVLAGAVIVGMIDCYWLLGGAGAYN